MKRFGSTTRARHVHQQQRAKKETAQPTEMIRSVEEEGIRKEAEGRNTGEQPMGPVAKSTEGV